MSRVRFASCIPDNLTLEVRPDESLLDAALRKDVPHAHACGGTGLCSTCRILVSDGLEHCNARTADERCISDRLQFPDDIRLACQTTIEGPVTFRRLVIDAYDVQFADVRTHDGPAPVGRQRELAVLFADIRGFTPLAADLLPYDVIYLLRRYFTDSQEIIDSRRGRITSYMGDGLMAIFGLENPDDGPFDAVAAGVDMLAAVGRRTPQYERLFGRLVELNIGVHVGTAIVGAVGSWGDTPPLTAIGDTVNVASRIEQANKQTGTAMLVSAPTAEMVRGRVELGRRFTVQLDGKSGDFDVVEVTGLRS